MRSTKFGEGNRSFAKDQKGRLGYFHDVREYRQAEHLALLSLLVDSCSADHERRAQACEALGDHAEPVRLQKYGALAVSRDQFSDRDASVCDQADQ